MQFVLGPHCPTSLRNWRQVRIGEQLHLAAHPDLNVAQASNGTASLTLIGYLLDPNDPRASDQDILDRLISSIDQFDDLFNLTYPLGGRWVLILNDNSRMRLVADATSLRQVFYVDPQYSDERWCASQPSHIASELGFEVAQQALDFIDWLQSQKPGRSWWPGDSSPFKEIRRLLPNHYLDLIAGKTRRFWPHQAPPATPIDEAIEKISVTLPNMINAAAARFDLAMGMSAGWDSRLMLAASKAVAQDLSYYTSKLPDMDRGHMDVHIPIKLLTKLKLNHDIIEIVSEGTPEFTETYKKSISFAHNGTGTPSQSQLNHYKQRKVAVTGNVSEIARSVYRRPDKPNQLTAEYLMKVSGISHPFAKPYFDAWLAGVGDPRGYDILDLFYWEQRIGRWFAHNCLAMDMTWQEVFVPFNNRELLVDALAVDKNLREDGSQEFYRQLMRRLWPEVLSEPINPVMRGTRQNLRNLVNKYFGAIARRMKRIVAGN